MESHLPAMAPHSSFSAWIERHETLLTSALLSGEQGLCGLFVSRDANGDYLLRRCEGVDEGWMVWREQRRIRSLFGRSYVDAIATAWIRRSERQGHCVEWLARVPEAVGEHLALPLAA
jgi:hypothetical protein